MQSWTSGAQELGRRPVAAAKPRRYAQHVAMPKACIFYVNIQMTLPSQTVGLVIQYKAAQTSISGLFR
jgi:hypothetical protein